MDLRPLYIILGISVLILILSFNKSDIKVTETVSFNQIQKMVSETMK